MALTKGEETGLMIVNSKDYYEFEPENWTVPWYHDLVPKVNNDVLSMLRTRYS
jgi:hypothetical protein